MAPHPARRRGPGAPSLAVHIFSQIQFGADPSIFVTAALQIVIVGGLPGATAVPPPAMV